MGEVDEGVVRWARHWEQFKVLSSWEYDLDSYF